MRVVFLLNIPLTFPSFQAHTSLRHQADTHNRSPSPRFPYTAPFPVRSTSPPHLFLCMQRPTRVRLPCCLPCRTLLKQTPTVACCIGPRTWHKPWRRRRPRGMEEEGRYECSSHRQLKKPIITSCNAHSSRRTPAAGHRSLSSRCPGQRQPSAHQHEISAEAAALGFAVSRACAQTSLCAEACTTTHACETERWQDGAEGSGEPLQHKLKRAYLRTVNR